MTELANNRKALFDYEILETLEAGLALTGPEVKSVKKGQLSLKGAFVTFLGDRPMLTGAHISPYKPAGNISDYDPTRSRPLLMHKRQIKYLKGKSQEAGLTIVPISVYTNNRLIKIAVAVARGRHHYDKRELIKKRDIERDTKRILKDL